jgi:hypothetical protein
MPKYKDQNIAGRKLQVLWLRFLTEIELVIRRFLKISPAHQKSTRLYEACT